MGIFFTFSASPAFRCLCRLAFFSVASWLFLPAVCGQWNPLNPVRSSQKDASSLTLLLDHGALRLEVCSDSIIRILYSSRSEFPSVADHVVVKKDWPPVEFAVQESADNFT